LFIKKNNLSDYKEKKPKTIPPVFRKIASLWDKTPLEVDIIKTDEFVFLDNKTKEL
jgi:hypothetical protein